MEINIELKTKILAHLKEITQSKVLSLENELSSLLESRNSETKSSAGDKHETSRALVQIEIEQHQRVLQKCHANRNILDSISTNNILNEIVLGSLTKTTQGFFFLSYGLGTIIVQNMDIHVISTNSPIGSKLLNKKEGEIVFFREKEIRILSIL